MRAWLRYIYTKLRTSFWLIPGLLTVIAGLLAVLVTEAERGPLSAAAVRFLPLYGGGPEGARLLLSTIAGSMITVTSLVFSLTLVSLTLASSQLGPRLISIFMSDRITQIVLGVFIATFVFALLVLRSIIETEPDPFIPRLSVSISMLLVLCSFGWLIFFIHHLSGMLQADEILTRVSRELFSSFRESERLQWQKDVPAFDRRAGTVIRSHSWGYVQAIDYGALLDTCCEQDVRILVRLRPGNFVIAGEELAVVLGPPKAVEPIQDALRKFVVVGSKRSDTQDPEYGLEAMVEIGVRALSPSLNDFRTALACIDHVTWFLAGAMVRGLPAGPVLVDGKGVPRLEASVVTFHGLVKTSMDVLRQNAGNDVPVTIRLIEAIIVLGDLCEAAEYRTAIREQLDALVRSISRTEFNPMDMDDVQERLKRAMHSLQSGARTYQE